jgi:hypothetical protein
MKPEVSSPHSQQPTTRPYTEPGKSSPCSHPTSCRSVSLGSSHLPTACKIKNPLCFVWSPGLFLDDYSTALVVQRKGGGVTSDIEDEAVMTRFKLYLP